MFTNKISKLALAFLMAVLLVSCTIPLKAIRTGPENPAVVPEAFDPKQNVLLVVAIPRLDDQALVDMKSTIKLEEELQKQYLFPYKIVSPKELSEVSKQYTDTLTYRFALVSERRLVKQKGYFQLDVEEGLAFVPGYKATYIDFAFVDRVTKQRFPSSGISTTDIKLAVNNLTSIINKAAEKKAAEKLKFNTAQNTKGAKEDVSFTK